MKSIAKIMLVLMVLAISGQRHAFGLTLPVEGICYSKFPCNEDEDVSNLTHKCDPRCLYSVVYCGRYIGSWCARGEGSGSHPGVDIRVNPGTPIRAIADGKIVSTGAFWRWGNTIVIEHTNMPDVPPGEPIYSVYAHLSTVRVKNGDEVQEGSIIGLSGDSEIAEMPHLHFQIDRYVEGGSHPFFPARDGQCSGWCEWIHPKHVVNNPDADYQVRRNTINPIKYILQFKDYRPVEDLQLSSGNKPFGQRTAILVEERLYKGSGQEIYLFKSGVLHLMPDFLASPMLEESNPKDRVAKVSDNVLFMIPKLYDIPSSYASPSGK